MKTSIGRALAVLAAALLLSWPAILNRYPLIFPDSATYLRDGHTVLVALLGHPHPPLPWKRSPLYALSLLPIHRNRTPWPIVPLHTLAVSYILWLVVRFFTTRHTLLRFLGLITFLALATGLAWDCSWIMPDVLGSVAYLGLFLLVFAWPALSRLERLLVLVLTCWGTVAHVTHILIMGVLCLLLLLLTARHASTLQARSFRISVAGAGRALLVFAVAATLQLAVNTRLYGHPSITSPPPRPPFLMAHLIGDGPALHLLHDRCANHLDWSVCRFLPLLAAHPDHFLWNDDGVLANSSPAEITAMDRQELPLLAATLHRYPIQQLRKSAGNLFQQLITFDLDDFADSPATDLGMERAMPGAGASYRHSRQFTSSMPNDLFSAIQNWTVSLACLCTLGLLFYLRSRVGAPLLALTVIVTTVLITNAAITGILADVDSRYQLRVIWLLPLLAALYLFRWLDLRTPPAAQTS